MPIDDSNRSPAGSLYAAEATFRKLGNGRRQEHGEAAPLAHLTVTAIHPMLADDSKCQGKSKTGSFADFLS